MHHHIGLFNDQAHQDFLSFGMLDIQREAFFGAVGPDKVRGQAAHTIVIATRKVAHARAFDFDDACAHVGQLARGERRGNRMFKRDDRDAF